MQNEQLTLDSLSSEYDYEENEENIVKIIKSKIRPQYISNSQFKYIKNKNKSASIRVYSDVTSYRDATPENGLVFALIDTIDKERYIIFKLSAKPLFISANINFITKKILQKESVMIELSTFVNFIKNNSLASEIIEKIYTDIFNFKPFGCCSKYVECSNTKRCVMSDPVYATACQYRNNLSNNKIFYGDNKNI